MTKSIVSFTLLVALSTSTKLPSSFQKCNRNQPDFKQCSLKAAQNAIPQLAKPFPEVKLPSLSPFEISEVKVNAGTGSVAVDQHFKNVKIYGLADVKFDKFDIDYEKRVIGFAGVFPEIKILSYYSLNGKILLLPIKGNGEGEMILKNLKANASIHYEEVKQKGKTFASNFKVSDAMVDPELVTFHLENLFDGDKELSDQLHQVLNENWKIVFEDLKDVYLELIVTTGVRLLTGFFSTVSLEEALD